MIRTFGDKRTERIWNGEGDKKLEKHLQDRVVVKLRMLNNAAIIDDLRIPPSNHLEALQGDRRGQFSIRVNNKWRICFMWNDGHMDYVELVDYH